MKWIDKMIVFALATITILIAPHTLAAWPEKPIKITIPYKAGLGATTQLTRQLQKVVAETGISKQPIIVFNVGGPAEIGIRQVKDQRPDGYNFLVVNTAIMTLEATGKIDFGWKNFEPVAQLGSFCLVEVVNKNTGISTLDQLLDRAEKKSNTLVYGVNLGAVNHIFGLKIEDLRPGAKFRFVQTGGGASTFSELLSGRVQVASFPPVVIASYVLGVDGNPKKNSPVRLLAYAGPQRNPVLPSVPTFKKLGYDLSFCTHEWFFAPKGTPKAAIDGFARIVKQSLNDKGMQTFLKNNGMLGDFNSGQKFAAELEHEWQIIKAIAPRAGKKGG